MKKIIPILIVGLFVLSGLGAVALPVDEQKVIEQSKTILFSDPIINEEGKYISIKLDEATSELREVGKPTIPVVTKVFVFPSETIIEEVEVTFSGVKTEVLSKPVIPARKSIPLSAAIRFAPELKEDEEVYESTGLYPEEQWSYKIVSGMNNNNDVVYVSIQMNPVQYEPANNRIYVATSADIKISYVPSPDLVIFEDAYDLLIVAPEKFSDKLQLLIEHKNSYGVQTILKTTDQIYTEYSAGRDDPEKIKLCIYDMKETYDISYVLLVGGRIGQLWRWYIPERVVANDDGWEEGYSSDLYYADIYKNNGTEFEDWDSNGNGIFAEWWNAVDGRDIIDYVPDVAVGRLACRYGFEVDIMVDKIIEYESSACDPSWFKKMICIAGDTFVPGINGDYSGVAEGEIECDHAASFLEPLGFDIEKLYTSDGSFSGPSDVTNSISNGAGFVIFAGHGSPSTWGNHPPEDDNFTTGLQLRHMQKLRNSEKLPIVVVGGCHNSQFNVTFLNFVKGIRTEGKAYFDEHFWHKTWVPECWSWWLARKSGGGSIATIGCSGLGYGDLGYATLDHRGGWIDGRFFDCYGNQSIDILGDVHSQAITDYITIIGGENSKQLDRKTIEGWALLGDPSLKIGGYS